MIEESYVSFDTAKMLKKAGFDVPCTSQYTDNGFGWDNLSRVNYNSCESLFSRPTQALAARWLREKFGIHIFANYFFEDNDWFYIIVDINKPDEVRGIHSDIRSYPTCEEALEAGLKYSLELIKR